MVKTTLKKNKKKGNRNTQRVDPSHEAEEMCEQDLVSATRPCPHEALGNRGGGGGEGELTLSSAFKLAGEGGT